MKLKIILSITLFSIFNTFALYTNTYTTTDITNSTFTNLYIDKNNFLSLDPRFKTDSKTILLVHFDKNTSSTLYADNNDSITATINGASYTTGYFGKAMNFPQTYSKISFDQEWADNIYFGGQVTVEFWINSLEPIPLAPNTWHNIMAKAGSFQITYVGFGDCMAMGNIWTKSMTYFENKSSFLTISTISNDVKTNNWYHIAFVYDQDAGIFGESRFYINGYLLTTTAFSSALTKKEIMNNASGNDLTIGAQAGKANALNCKLDEVRISSTVRYPGTNSGSRNFIPNQYPTSGYFIQNVDAKGYFYGIKITKNSTTDSNNKINFSYSANGGKTFYDYYSNETADLHYSETQTKNDIKIKALFTNSSSERTNSALLSNFSVTLKECKISISPESPLSSGEVTMTITFDDIMDSTPPTIYLKKEGESNQINIGEVATSSGWENSYTYKLTFNVDSYTTGKYIIKILNAKYNSGTITTYPVVIKDYFIIDKNSIIKPNVNWYPDVFYTSDNNIAKLYISNLKSEKEVSIKIYSITGVLVKTILNKTKLSKYTIFTWDGTDKTGHKLRQDTYFTIVTIGNTSTQAMITIIN